MTVKLLWFMVRRRPIYLTDWLDAPVDLKVWAFEKLGWHKGVHEVCPGWCPCEVDLDLDELELAAA